MQSGAKRQSERLRDLALRSELKLPTNFQNKRQVPWTTSLTAGASVSATFIPPEGLDTLVILLPVCARFFRASFSLGQCEIRGTDVKLVESFGSEGLAHG